MKSILISVDYPRSVLLPPECAQYLPQFEIVESQGYGLDRTTRLCKDRLEVTLVDREDILADDVPPPAIAVPVPVNDPGPVAAAGDADPLATDIPF